MTTIAKATDGQRQPPRWRRIANWAIALGLGLAGGVWLTGCATDDRYAGPLPVVTQPDGVPVYGDHGRGFGAGQVTGDGRYRETGVSDYTAAATQLGAGQPAAAAAPVQGSAPAATAGAEASAAPPPPPAPAGEGGVPVANWADAGAGLVYSPHGTSDQLVDVAGMDAGSTVKCPYTGKLFRVPAAPGS